MKFQIFSAEIAFRIDQIFDQGRQRTAELLDLADHPGNRRDLLYRRLAGSEAQKLVSTKVLPAPELEKGAVKGRFDNVLA